MQLKCLTLCPPPPRYFGLRKGQALNCADKYNLIGLSALIDFGYALSDTQDARKRWRIGFIFCGEHPLLLTRIQVSDLVFSLL